MLERGGGAIVNTASAAAFYGSHSLAAYGTSKAGLVALTRYVATAYGERGIRCNAVAPGVVVDQAAQEALGGPMGDRAAPLHARATSSDGSAIPRRSRPRSPTSRRTTPRSSPARPCASTAGSRPTRRWCSDHRRYSSFRRRAQQRDHRTGPGRMAHEADAPRLARELAEPAADLDAVARRAAPCAASASSAPSGSQAVVSSGQAVALLGDDEPEAELGQRVLEAGADGAVAGPGRLEPLVEHRAERGVQRERPSQTGAVWWYTRLAPST